MAEDHFKVRRHELSKEQKYMEKKVACTFGGSESTMKFSPKRLESPPPKPPRRRFSDQLSMQSLGTYSSLKKTNEEKQRKDSMLKRYNSKPAYLSLPDSLTTDTLNDCSQCCDCTSNLLLRPSSLSDQLMNLKENEHPKSFDNLKNCPKQTFANNKFSCKEKSHFIIPELNSDNLFSKYQHEKFSPYFVDKISGNSFIRRELFMTDTCINENLKLLHKECHRRHHSDPAISNLNLHRDNSVKLNSQKFCDNIQYTARRVNKYSNSTGSCCKRSNLIIQEMRNLKEINYKLWHHLCSLQTCLENSKKKTDESDLSISGLLSSIYYAQKTKDTAVEERIKLALDERDAAVQELEDLIHALSKQYDYVDAEKEVDKDIKELLREMESIMNPSKFIKYQKILLNWVQNFQESKQKCLSQKLKQAMIERDNALEKVKNLEEEVRDLKLCYDLWHSDNKHWEFTMFDIINQITHQRDALLCKVDGLDIGSVTYRPILTKKHDIVEYQNIPHESHSKLVESLKNQSMNLGEKEEYSICTTEEIMQLRQEILLLNKVLEGEKKKREHTEEKCLRLERLIHILRKKLNGQNVGVLV